MGDRAWVQIQSEQFATPIALYSHWSGTDNLTAVRSVLAKTQRIGDAGYLTAQIFWKLANLAHYDGKLSLGIHPDTIPLDYEENPTVYVNADTGDYKIEDGNWVSNQELRATYEYGTSNAA
jgi:hypothetical protein